MLSRTIIATALLAMLGGASASGQSNSLFRRGVAQRTPPSPAAPTGPAAQAQRPTEAAAGSSGAGSVTAGAPAGAPVEQRVTTESPLGLGIVTRPSSSSPNSPVHQSVNPTLEFVSPYAVVVPPPETVKVHDLVTIIVREDKSATSDSKLTTDKKWDFASDLTKFIRLNEQDKLVPQNFPEGTPAIDFNWKDKWEGTGKVERKDALVTRITAEVIDVKPNGNLVLEARKRIKIDEDEQIATLTGVCRSKDMTAQNTVLSTQVADVQINIEHSGAARDAARRGWLKRAADFLRPF